MKKILMISHSSGGGGAETVFLKAVDSLKEENNLTVAINSDEGYLIEKIKSNNIKLININNFWLHSSVIKFLLRLIFWNSISILKLIKIC